MAKTLTFQQHLNTTWKPDMAYRTAPDNKPFPELRHDSEKPDIGEEQLEASLQQGIIAQTWHTVPVHLNIIAAHRVYVERPTMP